MARDGYTTERREWPADLEAEWHALEGSVSGAAERFEEYGAISKRYSPADAHHYLGVLGVHPDAQGTGVGHRLLEHVCEMSREDPVSKGVYLETANPDSLAFYRKRGFDVLGEEPLGSFTLWCVFRPTP